MKTNRFLSFLAAFAVSLVLFACSGEQSDLGGEPSSNSTGGQQDERVFCRLNSGACSQISLSTCMEFVEAGTARIVSGCDNGGNGGSSSSDISSVPVQSSSSAQSSSSRITCEPNHLGKGYDVIRSAYINSSEVKPNPILDQDKLCQANIIKISVSDPKQNFSISTGKSIKTFYEERNTKIGVDVNFFVGGLSTKFDTKKAENSTSQVYYAQLRSYNYPTKDEINTNTQNLSQYLTSKFAEDLENKTPEQIFALYGTHVFIRYQKGGYLEANYTYSGTSLTSESEVYAAIDGHYKVVSGNASTSDKMKDINVGTNTTFNYQTYGGTQLSAITFDDLTSTAFKTWINSINNTPKLSVISGIDNFDNSLVPIWNLVEDAAKATALKNAFNKLATDQGVAFPKAKIYETYNVPQYTAGGTKTITCPKSNCTFAEIEIYALGAGGGGQGGDNTSSGFYTDIGTGGAGGGGAATYAKLGKLGLSKNASISLDITIGVGGPGGDYIYQNISGQHSGKDGNKGGDTKIVYKTTNVIAPGGSPGYGYGNGSSPDTKGGDGGSNGNNNLPNGSNYYIEGFSMSGKPGSDGNWQKDTTSTGGQAATITGKGTISLFGGGLGATRSKSAESGGGGRGGYSNEKGTAGGNGLVNIVVKYFTEE